jgi:hypothetical protein
MTTNNESLQDGFPLKTPILTVFNNHIESCGRPPSFLSSDGYIGYFQNQFSEQWLFKYDRATSCGSLRGGDTGWEVIHEVKDGLVEGLVLAAPEAFWLAACWAEATGKPIALHGL